MRPAPSLVRSSIPFLFLLGISAAEGAGQDYAVRPGDQLEVRFFTAAGTEIREITGQRFVDQTGHIFLPYVGSQWVDGLDATGIRELLQEEFADFYSGPVIDVVVRLKVNVTGAVPRPGSFFLDPTSTVIDAVSEAGGTGTGVGIGNQVALVADASQVRLIRLGRTTIIDLTADATDSNRSMNIQSGDWVFVPPQSRSQWRDNIDFASSIVTLLAATAALVVLLTNN